LEEIMTIQYVQIQTYDFGASLSDVTLRNPLTDAVVATADSCPELSADSGIYRAEFDETSVIAAGLYRLRAVVSGSPLNRWVTLTGVDAELAYSRMERAVELDSATIDDITAPILAALQGSPVVQVASPNVQGNLVLTQGDDYDGVANPRAQWTVTTDYTTGWTVRLTIRDTEDAVVYTAAGSVVSATVVAVTIAAPTGLAMTGCPGQWQGKFDVELTHSTGKKKTIALGTCYINEDQTR
jgi:hypothetical protein